MLLERLLHRVQLAVRGQALDGGDLVAVGLDGEHRARLHRLAVEVDRARAARGRVAADVRAGQPEPLAEVVDEQRARFDLVVCSTPLTVRWISMWRVRSAREWVRAIMPLRDQPCRASHGRGRPSSLHILTARSMARSAAAT